MKNIAADAMNVFNRYISRLVAVKEKSVKLRILQKKLLKLKYKVKEWEK